MMKCYTTKETSVMGYEHSALLLGRIYQSRATYKYEFISTKIIGQCKLL